MQVGVVQLIILAPSVQSLSLPLFYLVTTIMCFDSCEKRHCLTVPIDNDEIIEETESFSATLERTPHLDHRMILSPTDADIIIIDDDGKLLNFTLDTTILFILYIGLCHKCYYASV